MVSKRPSKKKASTKRQISEALDHLVFVFRESIRGPQRRSIAAAALLVLVALAFVARGGTTAARASAGSMAILGIAAFAFVRWRERRTWEDPRVAIQRLAGRVAPERAARALRALTLLDDDGQAANGTSSALARLHVARQLEALPKDRIAEGADAVARRFNVATLALIAGAGVFIALDPFRPIEGLDVLFARHGIAPVGLTYVDSMSVRARPPDYLHMEERDRRPFEEAALPNGTLLTFRGDLAHDGRRVLLSDGKNEVPFVDDGTGKIVARWPLTGDVELRVVARFGPVVIEESGVTKVTAIMDEAPVVTLDGAPKRLELTALEGDIPIKYQARDDHGLREVHLVLRSGVREERRVLARLDGETREDSGGSLLRARDPFLKRSHAPIEIRVEAKDNDPITGPKWGASEAFTIIPPDVGQPEAMRMTALRKLRDAYVDGLAWNMEHPVPADAKDRPAFLADQKRRQADLADELDQVLDDSYAGAKIAARLASLLKGQAKKLADASTAEQKAPNEGTHKAVTKATGTMALVVDGIVRGLAIKDSKDAAKQLAEVADDLALGVQQVERPAETTRGMVRVDAAHLVLDGGEKQLMILGTLGRDLGGAIGAALLRFDRAKAKADWPHAELVARDLAARLHQPDPSFGSKGSGGRAGGESGGGRGTPSQEGEGEGSEAERAFREAAQDLEQLAQDHSAKMGDVEGALAAGASKEDLDQLRDESKKHADAVRDAIKGLPTVGGGSDSWTSKGSAARELGDQMARSLEQGDPADAVQSGKNALDAIDEAKRIAARERWRSFDRGNPDAERRLDEAKKKLEPEVQAAEAALKALRRKAAQRAQGPLNQAGDDEDELADRAKKLADRGRDQGALPQKAIDALDEAEQSARDASRSLKSGDADKGLGQQRDAQRALDKAREALGSDEEGEGEGDDGKTASNAPVDIPKADAHKGPEDFRKRVLQGLGQPSDGKHKDAVKRYAEGLLR